MRIARTSIAALTRNATRRYLRSLDALHLAAALRLGCRSVVTYDERMAVAARELGFDVVAPGAQLEG